MTSRTTLAAILSCALTLPALTAHAGFEWTPPPRVMPKAAPAPVDDIPPVPAAPALPVHSAPLPPAVVDAEQAAQAAMNEGAEAGSLPADPWAESADAPAALSDDPLGRIAAPGTSVPRGPHDEPAIMPRHSAMQMPAPTPVPAQAAVTPVPFLKAAPLPPPAVAGVPAAPMEMIAEGFGRDIPVALALSQIVPAGYNFAFAPGADAGARISWDGGRPWNHVLTDALAPRGMSAVVNGNTVIVHTGTVPAPYLPAPVAVTAMPMPAPETPAVPVTGASAQPASNGGGWRAVSDWQAEGDYTPSYPRRDVSAARERMMREAAGVVHMQEPSGNNPDTARDSTAIGDDSAMYNAEPVGVPMPLTEAEAPAAAVEAPASKSYSQLTGLNDETLRVVDPREIRYWQAQPGESLRTVLTNWSEQAGVQLFWAEGQDYQIPARVQMHGTFQSAIGKLLETFATGHPQPQGQLHANQPGGAAVLIIDHGA